MSELAVSHGIASSKRRADHCNVCMISHKVNMIFCEASRISRKRRAYRCKAGRIFRKAGGNSRMPCRNNNMGVQ